MPSSQPKPQKLERYDAFISYSRQDKSFATELEKALESYTPPKDMGVPHRRLNVFRDEADFTGTEYRKSIARHLQNSSKLLVVCSPAARASEYVEEEIQAFAQEKGAGSIIPLLLSGIPNNEAVPQTQFEEAFPDALCRAYGDGIPLAADFRGFVPKKDRFNRGPFESAWYRTLSELFGKSREEVEQRERKRHARRVRVALSTAALATAVLASLSVWALVERSKAGQQRDEALRQEGIAQDRANVAHSRRLAVEASKSLPNAPDLALLLSVAALHFADTAEARGSLLDALEHSPYLAAFLHGHRGLVGSLAFSPDGTQLASVGEKPEVMLWDWRERRLIETLQLPTVKSLKSQVSFHPSGQFLAIAADSDGVAVWDLKSVGHPGRLLSGHDGNVTSIAFSPDGTRLVSADSRGLLIFRSVGAWNQISAIGDQQEGGIYDLTFSPDGKWIVSLGDGPNDAAWLRDGSSGRVVSKLDPQDLQVAPIVGEGGDGPRWWTSSVAFTPDSQAAAVGYRNGAMILWDVQTHKPHGNAVTVASGSWVTSLAFDPARVLSREDSSKQWIMAAGDGSDHIQVFDLMKGRPIVRLKTTPDADTWSLAFSPDGQTLASGHAGGEIRLWDLRSFIPPGRRVLSRERDKTVTLAFSPDGSRLATGGAGGELSIWDRSTGELVSTFPIRTQGKIQALAYDPTGKILVSGGDDGYLCTWDLGTQQPIGEAIQAHSGGVNQVAFNPTGDLFASAGEDKTIRLWSNPGFAPVGTPMTGHESGVGGIAFRPDGKQMASVGDDNTLILWDVTDPARSAQNSQKLQGTANQSVMRHGMGSAAYTPDGRLLIAGGWDETLSLWDPAKPELLGTYRSPNFGMVQSLSISSNGGWVVLPGIDGTLVVWDVATRQPLGPPLVGHTPGVFPPWTISAVSFSRDGRSIASASSKELILWNFDPGNWGDRACRIANRNLTPAEWKDFLGDEPYRQICSLK